MTIPKLVSRSAVVVGGAAFVSLAMISTAFADCHEVGSTVGERTTHVGSSGSDQLGKWDLNGGSHPKIRGKVDPANLANDKCQDTYVDWATEDDHYDARIVRNCRHDSSRQTDGNGDGWRQEASPGPRTLIGFQKGAGCVYDISATDYNGTCNNYNINLDGCDIDDGDAFGAHDGNAFAEFWVRYPDNTINHFDGGFAWLQNS